MDASSASTLSTLPLSSFIAGHRLPARSSRYLGDELFVFSARAERNLVDVGKSYMKGMAEAALHQRARLLLLRSEEHTSELQSLMRISYAVFCLNTNKIPRAKSITLT